MDNPFAPKPKKSSDLPAEKVEKSPVPVNEEAAAESVESNSVKKPELVSENNLDEGLPAKENEEAEIGGDLEVDVHSSEFKAPENSTAPIAKVEPEEVEAGSPPPLDLEEVSCRSCRYFCIPEGHTRMDVLEGECRCKAPTPGLDAKAAWPSVDWGSWCGEWEQGISNDDMVRLARNVAESMNE